MIFDDLTPEEMKAVEAAGVLRAFAKDEFLLTERQPGDSFFLLLEGRVEVRKMMDIGQYRRLAELGPCDVVGEICFLGQPNRSASVIALSAGSALEFTRESFARLVAHNPLIGLKSYRGLARELGRRLAQLDDDLRDALMWAISQTRGK
jgi:CRP-like cAMP-binding protein